MQSTTTMSFLAFSTMGAVAASNARSEAEPLGKVLDLLSDLAAKVTKDGEIEVAAFKEYYEWCDDISTNKNHAVKTATAKKDKLEAKIDEASANIQTFDSEIEDLAGGLAEATADLKKATSIRAEESSTFVTGENELVETADTLTRAQTILEREMQGRGAAALAQVTTNKLENVMQALNVVVDAASFSVPDKKRLAVLLQSQQAQEADEDSLGAPSAAVYKSHSSSIVEVVADLLDKAEEQLSTLRKAETTARHSFEMLKQSLDDQLAHDDKNLEESKSDKAASEESKATFEGELAVTVADLKAAQEALEEAKASCMQVANDHDATERARNAELKVIAEATKILQDSSAGAVSQTYSLLQVSLQSRAEVAKSEVVAFMKKLAKKHHSTALAQLASRITSLVRYGSSAGSDPFGKIRDLVEDMIAKLQAEAASETTEKEFCDTEMAETAAKKGELDGALEKVNVKIDQAAAKSAELKAEVKELQAELAQMAAEQAEAEKVRQETNAAYIEGKADLEVGLQGVRRALNVLRTYYAKGEELLQQPAPPLPELHSAAGGAGNSIIGLLEVCESDFAMNLVKVETAETEAQEGYEQMTEENKIQTAANTQDVKYKTQEHTSLDKSVAAMSSDKQNLVTQLDAVLEYDAKLKKRCIAQPETYEERAARRESEIAGLKEALSILENEAALVQRKAAPCPTRRRRGDDKALRGTLSTQDEE